MTDILQEYFCIYFFLRIFYYFFVEIFEIICNNFLDFFSNSLDDIQKKSFTYLSASFKYNFKFYSVMSIKSSKFHENTLIYTKLYSLFVLFFTVKSICLLASLGVHSFKNIFLSFQVDFILVCIG